MRVYLAAHYDSRRLTPRRARKDDPFEHCFDITEAEFQEFFYTLDQDKYVTSFYQKTKSSQSFTLSIIDRLIQNVLGCILR